MGFFNTVTEVFKDNIKPKLEWSKNTENVKGLFSKKRAPASISIDTDDQEFITRYRNIRFSALSATLFMAISFVSLITSKSMLEFTTSSIAAVLFFLFYFRYSFVMWVCRKAWAEGKDLEGKVTTSPSDFIKDLMDNPHELLPLSIPDKGSKR